MTTIFFVMVPPPPLVGFGVVGSGVVGSGVVGSGVLVDVDVLVEVLVTGVLVVSSVVVSVVSLVVGVVGVGAVEGGRAVLAGGTGRDELAADEADEADDDGADDMEGALEDGCDDAEELRPGTVMLGEPVVDGTAVVATVDGSELGTGSAVVELPQLLRTTARATAGIRAAGTTRTRMAFRVPAGLCAVVSKPRVSAGSPTVET